MYFFRFARITGVHNKVPLQELTSCLQVGHDKVGGSRAEFRRGLILARGGGQRWRGESNLVDAGGDHSQTAENSRTELVQ